MTTTENARRPIHLSTGSVMVDLPDEVRGEPDDLFEIVIATFLDMGDGEVFLKGFESERFGYGEEKVRNYADRHGLVLVSMVTGEANEVNGTAFPYARR